MAQLPYMDTAILVALLIGLVVNSHEHPLCQDQHTYRGTLDCLRRWTLCLFPPTTATNMNALRKVLVDVKRRDPRVLGGSVAALFVVWKWGINKNHQGKLVTDLKDIANQEYDFIIVGGGTHLLLTSQY